MEDLGMKRGGPHPPLNVLERFIRCELRRDEARTVVRHLLATCSECVGVTGPLWRSGARARIALEQVQRALPAPSVEEVREMADGTRPLSAEVHLIGALQDALRALENVETDLQFAAAKRTRLRLEAEWKRGKLPHELEIRSIEAALAALSHEPGTVEKQHGGSDGAEEP
jgi:hypothetical protein